MHENRETSSLTEQSKESPAGKGQGRNPSTNGGEESDCAVLPMKQVNKATEQQAEAAGSVEGRARTKENIRQTHTAPTQNGRGVSKGLSGVLVSQARSSKGKEEGTVHHTAASRGSESAGGKLSGIKTESGTGSGWSDMEAV